MKTLIITILRPLVDVLAKFRRDTLGEFHFDLAEQRHDERLLVGTDHLRLTNQAGVVTIRDEVVQSITSHCVSTRVSKKIVKGCLTTKITHLSDVGSPIETTIKTDFEYQRGKGDPAIDRLADYRLRVANARPCVMAEELARIESGPTMPNFPTWATCVMGFCLLIVPFAVCRWLFIGNPDLVGRLAPGHWLLYVFVAFACSAFLLRNLGTRDSDLGEKGFRPS